MPAIITISAKIIEPARFPIYVQSQPNIESAKVTVPLRVPLKISRLYPVNNSEPPIITSDNAIPNVIPATILPKPGFIAERGAEKENPKITQNKKKNPANTESVKKPVRLCFIAVAFFNDIPASVSTAAVYNINYSPQKSCCKNYSNNATS